MWAQIRYANRTFWRTPVAAFFTLAFPVMFLVILSMLVGTAEVEPGSGVRVTQFLLPVAAVFCAVMAAYGSLAIGTAVQREQGVVKRLRGTPLPVWVYIAGRVGSAVWIAGLGTAVLVAIGLLFYDVQVQAAKLPALVVAMVVGIASFAALGLGVVALVRTSQAVTAVTIGSVVLLGFVSGMFTGPVTMPGWLETAGQIFPLKHFVDATTTALNPLHPGSGFAWSDVGFTALWGVVGAVTALRFFTFQPQGRQPSRQRTPRVRPVRGPVRVHPPTPWRLVSGQTVYAVRGLLRDVGSTFFAIVFPVALLMLLLTLFGDAVSEGAAVAPKMTAGMTVYAIAVTAYVNLAESVASARERGVLKRLGGTPLPPWAYLVGRLAATLGIAAVTAVLMLTLAGVVFDVAVGLHAVPGLVVTAVVGVACFAGLGLALAAVAPGAKAVSPIALGTLLPLSFISDVFVFGGAMPDLAVLVASLFPLKHFAAAAATALTATSASGAFAWQHYLVMLAWGMVGAVVAARLLRGARSPRAARTARGRMASTHPRAA